MKKALVILLAIFMVGAAFAEDVVAPTFSGSASATWGYDLQTGGSGFDNATDVAVTLPLAAKGSSTKGGDGMYGEIKVENFGFKLVQVEGDGAGDYENYFADIDGDGDTTVSISAKIVLSPSFNVGVYSKADIGIDYTDVISGGTDIDINDASHGGVSLNYVSDMFSLSGLVVSEGPEVDGTSNNYAGKIWAKVKPADVFNIEGAVTYNRDWNGSVDAGVKSVITVSPLTLTLASDMNISPTLAYDFRADAALVLVKDVANLDLAYFANTDFAYMDASAGLSGKVSVVAYGAKVVATDLTGTLGWKFTGHLAVTPVEDVTFAANFSYADTGAYDLVYDDDNSAISLTLGPKFHTVDNTTFTFKYADLAGASSGVTDKGEFTIAASISF
jgi:hypothetical protein